jgi:uncharacterized protein YkwD
MVLRKLVAAFATAIVAAACATFVVPASAIPPPAAPAGDPDRSDAAQLLVLVNNDRVSAGLAPLALSGVAVEVAESWSQHMAAAGELAHNDEWFSTSTRQRAGAGVVGENVALNATVEGAHRRLMGSPAHRANILDGRFQMIGVAIVADAAGMKWVTQDFMQSKEPVILVSEPSPESPEPTNPPPPQAPAPPTGTATMPPATTTTTELPVRAGGSGVADQASSVAAVLTVGPPLDVPPAEVAEARRDQRGKLELASAPASQLKALPVRVVSPFTVPGAAAMVLLTSNLLVLLRRRDPRTAAQAN